MNINQADGTEAVRRSARARLAESAVAAMTGLPTASLRHGRRRRRPVARARQMAMYLAHVAFGLTLTQVGVSFGRDRTTVRHACAVTEDGRDDPGLELGLSALEAGILALDGALAGECRS